jgi:hypothetical protein
LKTLLRSLMPKGNRLYRVIAGPMKGMFVSVDLSKDTQVVRGIYERAVLEWMQSVITLDMHCLDVGAAEGTMSLFMAKLVGLNGRVTAFEPSLRISNLEPLIRANSSVEMSTIQLVPKLVGTETTTDMVSLDQYEIETVHRVDFVKIDVDGFEQEVLTGAINTMTTCRPYVMVEVHSVKLEDFVLNYFHDLGYETFVVSPPTHEHRPIDHNKWVFCDPKVRRLL